MFSDLMIFFGTALLIIFVAFVLVSLIILAGHLLVEVDNFWGRMIERVKERILDRYACND